MISKHAFCCKITKNSKGGPFGVIKKFSKKSRTVPKKIKRGDPLASAGFVCFLEKVKNERWDPMDLLPWRDLALGGFRIVSKKWTDQCEDCSLKKKKGHCYSRAFFLKRIKRRLKKTVRVGHFSFKGKCAD